MIIIFFVISENSVEDDMGCVGPASGKHTPQRCETGGQPSTDQHTHY